MPSRTRSKRAGTKKRTKKPTPTRNKLVDREAELKRELDVLLAQTPTPQAPPPLPTPESPPKPEAPPPAPERPPEPAKVAPTPPAPIVSGPTASPTTPPVPLIPTPTAEPPSPAAVPSAPPAPSLPHFEAVAPRADEPAEQPLTDKPVTDDQWLHFATTRRGNPELVLMGWSMVLVGLALLAATYYWGVTYGNLFAPAGVRGDLIGAILLLIGLALGITFIFVPAERKTSPGADATPAELQSLVRYTNGQLLLSQILTGIGVALIALGIIWMTYWLRLAYLTDEEIRTTFGGVDAGTHVIGLPLILVGFCVMFFFLGRIPTARRARNLAVLLMHQRQHPSPQASAAPVGLPAGITEAEIRSLVKRLDGLMAQLPDAAVTEFSKTADADTYLKLLEP